MYDILAGVRIVEVAGWTFVPAAGAVCADWGADVIKVESPEGGDPQRGLFTAALGDNSPDVLLQQPNRGKISLALDIRTPRGAEVLRTLVATADVFLTNVRAPARKRLGIDTASLRDLNDRLIIAAGTGQGPLGPDADKGGFDLASAWARSGMAYRLTQPDATEPARFPPAFVDIQGGLTIAAGIAAALFHRERTGKVKDVDVSLLGLGAWIMSPDIIAGTYAGQAIPDRPRADANNPLVNSYRTADGRWLYLVLLQGDRYWADLCIHLDRPDLVDDERFATQLARQEHRRACIAVLDTIFASRSLPDWAETLETLDGVWAPIQSPAEVQHDVQAVANGYFSPATGGGKSFDLVASPVQFGHEALGDLKAAPALGDGGEDLMRELGYGDDQIMELKIDGALL